MASTMVNGSTSSAMSNGHAAEGAAGPSKQHLPVAEPNGSLNGVNEYDAGIDALQAVQQEHDASIVTHIYTSGFQQGNYADIQLFVLNRSYRLHRLILSRSPYLEHLINSPNNGSIFVPIENVPHITDESFAIALGFLYSSASISLVSPLNARTVLATGCLLGGMDALCAHAYDVCKNSISIDTLDDWLEFLQQLPLPSSSSDTASVSGSNSGTATPNGGLASPSPSTVTAPVPLPLPAHLQYGSSGGTSPLSPGSPMFGPGGINGHHSPSPSPGPIGVHPLHGGHPHSHSHQPSQSVSLTASIFGPYALQLRDALMQFLISELPDQLAATASTTASLTAPQQQQQVVARLSDVYAKLPFEYFKACVESPELRPVWVGGSSQERFKFAKGVVALRKRGVARDTEETVVMAFGGDTGSAVHVTRRQKGGRRLLKVGGK
ncbi:hypothetical protein DL93DRAFT_2091395 [Clavulina sp. PMI_390]|nr:hypothetical protein DL93DRAFT_2091395 [Clavulina sp. PMI_390]